MGKGSEPSALDPTPVEATAETRVTSGQAKARGAQPPTSPGARYVPLTPVDAPKIVVRGAGPKARAARDPSRVAWLAAGACLGLGLVASLSARAPRVLATPAAVPASSPDAPVAAPAWSVAAVASLATPSETAPLAAVAPSAAARAASSARRASAAAAPSSSDILRASPF